MITSSTPAHHGSAASVDARSAARTEHGGEFREEVARGRARERAGEQAVVATRSSAAQRWSADEEVTHDVPSERESVQDDATADRTAPTAVSGGGALDSEPNVDPVGEVDPQRSAVVASAARRLGSKDAASPQAAKAEADLVVPSTPILDTAAIQMLDAMHGFESRLQALFSAGDDVAPANQALKATTTPTMVGVNPSPASAAAGISIVDPNAHGAPELVRNDSTLHVSSEIGSPAMAHLAGRSAPTAGVAGIPPDPVARLSPADLPEFFESLQVRVDGALGNAFVELEPPELGRLTVEISLQPDGGVRADVRAENQDGFAALGARLQEMRTALLDRGFTSADVQLSLGLGERESHPESDSKSPRRSQEIANRELDAERVLALATSGGRSIDVWA